MPAFDSLSLKNCDQHSRRLEDHEGVVQRQKNGRRSRLMSQKDAKKYINPIKLISTNSTIAPTSQLSPKRQPHTHVTSSIVWPANPESEEFKSSKGNGSRLSLVGWSVIFPLALLGLWALRKKLRVNTVDDQTSHNQVPIMEEDGCSTVTICGKVEDIVLENSCIELAATKTCSHKTIFPRTCAVCDVCRQDNLDQTRNTFDDYVSFRIPDSQK